MIATDSRTSIESNTTDDRIRELIEKLGLQPGASATRRVAAIHTSTHSSNAEPFRPKAPESMAQTGLEDCQLEALVLKFLLNHGVAVGAAIAKQVRLPFSIVSDFVRRLKESQLVVHRRSSGTLGDFEFQLTDKGIEQSKRFVAQSTYHGAAPVPFHEYVAAVADQSVLWPIFR